MKTEVTMSNLWWNESLMSFFFRRQASDTLTKLIDMASEHTEFVLDQIEDYADVNDFDLDTIEEMFYDMTVEELAEEFEVELEEEDEDEED